jgi:hypothetical protein
VIVILLAGCARTVPPDRTAAALYRDLERTVTVQEAEGWDIDRTEVDSLTPTALLSVCRTPVASREKLLSWLDERIAKLGGPVDEAWRKRGKKLSRVATLLDLTRIRLLLTTAMDAAPRDCPFYLEPRDDFDGRQIVDDRWLLTLEGGGKAIITKRGDRKPELTGGGAGRVLAGYTFGSRLTLLAGAELDASADFPRLADGTTGSLVFAFDAVTPLVFRWHFVNSFADLEGGYLMHFTENDYHVTSGVRVGLAFGASALRKRWLIPGLAFALSYERTFPDDGTPALTVVKAGIRVSIDIAH